MDKVDWSQERFNYIRDQLQNYFYKENLFRGQKVLFIPISAFKGENLLTKAKNNWYKDEPLLKVLEKIEHIHVKEEITKPMRLVVKNVFKGQNNRSGYGFTVKVE